MVPLLCLGPEPWCKESQFYSRLCMKVGRRHRDACVGTWDLETRDEGLEDIKYGMQGRVGWGCGNVKNRDAGDAGCE